MVARCREETFPSHTAPCPRGPRSGWRVASGSRRRWHQLSRPRHRVLTPRSVRDLAHCPSRTEDSLTLSHPWQQNMPVLVLSVHRHGEPGGALTTRRKPRPTEGVRLADGHGVPAALGPPEGFCRAGDSLPSPFVQCCLWVRGCLVKELRSLLSVVYSWIRLCLCLCDGVR